MAWWAIRLDVLSVPRTDATDDRHEGMSYVLMRAAEKWVRGERSG